MSEIDIFDLSDVSDIPQEIRSDLKVFSRDAFERNILELFKRAARDLTIDEITVAYYRVFKENKDRKQIMTKLYNMARSERPSIESIIGKKGMYRLASDLDSPVPF